MVLVDVFEKTTFKLFIAFVKLAIGGKQPCETVIFRVVVFVPQAVVMVNVTVNEPACV